MGIWSGRKWYLAPICVNERGTVSDGVDCHTPANVGGSILRWPASALLRVSVVPDDMPDDWERVTFAESPRRKDAKADCAMLCQGDTAPLVLAASGSSPQGWERHTFAIVPDNDETGRGAAFDPDADGWAYLVPLGGRVVAAVAAGVAVPASWAETPLAELVKLMPDVFNDAADLGV